MALVLFSCTQTIYAWSRGRSVTLTSDESTKVAAALNLYDLGSPWSSQTTLTALNSVALSGQNIGGQTAATKRTYVVKGGDVLSGIAKDYGFSVGTLLLANPGLQGNANLIRPGQTLDIPDHEATADQLAQLPKPKVLASVSKSTPTSSATSVGGLLAPVPYQYISQPFSAVHPGEDLVAPYGTPIHSVAQGCIVSTTGGWNGGYGNLVIEDLGNGLTARYAHMLGFADGVEDGACLPAGTLLGYVGLTGNTTGPHLHFELRQNGVPIRPPFK